MMGFMLRCMSPVMGNGTASRIAAVRRSERDRSEADMPGASEAIDLAKMTQCGNGVCVAAFLTMIIFAA